MEEEGRKGSQALDFDMSHKPFISAKVGPRFGRAGKGEENIVTVMGVTVVVIRGMIAIMLFDDAGNNDNDDNSNSNDNDLPFFL